MDADIQIEQANALHSLTKLINEKLQQSGPQDWERGILVLRSADAEAEKVVKWSTGVWTTEGETGGFPLGFDSRPVLDAYRAATLADNNNRWVTCLIEFHRSGKIRTRFEYQDPERWWNSPDESSRDFMTRMRPDFDIPS